MGYIIKYLELCLLFNEWAVTDLPQCWSLIWKEVWGKEIGTDFSWLVTVDSSVEITGARSIDLLSSR